MLDVALEALLIVTDPARIGWMLAGVGVGLTVGLLPGLGGVVGMSILLPFVFGMDAYSGTALMIGMLSVTNTSDTFPSVLMGVPGSSAAQATIMDGYPMAQQGQARRALGAAFISSMTGGLLGAVFLIAAIFLARPLVLALGSPELFMITLLGLSMVGVLSRGSAVAGLLSGLIGLMIGTIGGAPGTASYRFTFDLIYLRDGIPLGVLALGLFALPEMVDLVAANRSISKGTELGGRLIDGVRDAMKNKWLIVRSSALGSFIGMLPGMGGAVVDWISYGLAKQTCKDTENFGKGDVRGVIAPEASNNATEGGSLVPALLFGIPGSGGTAILLGGLITLGLRPGPSMINENLDVTISIVWTLAMANVIGAGACFLLSRQIAKLSLIPAERLAPFLLLILVVASYQSSENWGDILVLLTFGVVGWFMKQLGVPRPPLLIGFVLSAITERYLHISMSRYGFGWISRPGVIVIGVVILVIVFGFSGRTARRATTTSPADPVNDPLDEHVGGAS